MTGVPRWRRPRPVLAIALLAVLVTGAALAATRVISGADNPRPTLRLLVVEDLADTDELVLRAGREVGVEVRIEHATMGALLSRAAGNGFENAYDAVWLPEFGAGALPDAVEKRLESGTAVMTSPLVLGLRPAAVARLDPQGTGLTWRALATAAAADRFSFGMVGPSGDAGADLVGRAILLGMATGLADPPDALTAHDVFRVSPQLRALHARQLLTPATSQGRTDAFRQAGPGAADGLLTEESRLLRVNAAPGGAAPLTVVVPGGRAVSARYMLRPLVSTSDPTARTEVGRLTERLLNPKSQDWIATRTYRRPVAADVLARYRQFPAVREIAIPRDPRVADRAVQVYQDDAHYPTRVVFVLDTSGSMRGKGMADLRRAFASLDGTIATRRGASVQVLLIPFSTAPAPTVRIEVDAARPAAGLAALAGVVAKLEPGGDTAIYAALERADDELTALVREGDDRVTSVILITDGENTTGSDLTAFRRHRETLRQERCGQRSGDRCQAPVFPVLVAEADPVEMAQVATLTGGKVHDARTVDLAVVLRDLAAGR